MWNITPLFPIITVDNSSQNFKIRIFYFRTYFFFSQSNPVVNIAEPFTGRSHRELELGITSITHNVQLSTSHIIRWWRLRLAAMIPMGWFDQFICATCEDVNNAPMFHQILITQAIFTLLIIILRSKFSKKLINPGELFKKSEKYLV